MRCMISESHPFYLHFQKVYGERWPALYEALLKPEQQVARENSLSPVTDRTSKKWAGLPVKSELPGCHWITPGAGFSPER